MDNDLSQIRRWLDEERRDLARFERGARWLMFAMFAGGLLGLAVLASLGCSEDVPRDYAALDGDEPTGDSGDPGDSATDAPTDEEPMGSVSDSATLTDDPETTFGNTEPTDAPATDELQVTDPLPDTGPNPTADTSPADTGSDLPSDTGVPQPGTDYPWPTDPVPTDTWTDVPTTEPEPTGEPEPTVDSDTGSDELPCYQTTGYNGSRKWRQPTPPEWSAVYAAQGDTPVDGRDICQEMNVRADCGITTWRMAGLTDFTAQDVVFDDTTGAPCMCRFLFAAADQCLRMVWAGPMNAGSTRWQVVCARGVAPYYLAHVVGYAWDEYPIWCLSDGVAE